VSSSSPNPRAVRNRLAGAPGHACGVARARCARGAPVLPACREQPLALPSWRSPSGRDERRRSAYNARRPTCAPSCGEALCLKSSAAFRRLGTPW
jgi:hypothetical protein